MSTLRSIIGGVTALLAALCMSSAAGVTPAATAKPEGTRATKVRLLERFGSAPQLLIFGSSRAMRADPAYVRRLTGLRGFNCAVSSGTPADAWAFMHLTRDLYPGSTQRYIWLLDMEQLRRSTLQPKLRTVPRLIAYLPEGFRERSAWNGVLRSPTDGIDEDGLALPEAASSRRAWRARQVRGAGAPRGRSYGFRMVYRRDGYLIWGIRDYYAAAGYTTRRCVRSNIYYFRFIYPKGFRAIRGLPAWFVREGIRQMNEWGVRPVIVLTPYHPDLRRAISDRGWRRRHAEVRRFFRHLAKELQFKLLDFTRLVSFGGWPGGFYDGIHPRHALTNRMLRQVVRRSRPYLRPVPTPTPTPTPTPSPTPTATPSPTPSPAPTPSTTP